MNTRLFVRAASLLKWLGWGLLGVVVGSLAFIISIRADTPFFLDISRTNSHVAVTWTNPGAVLQSAPGLTGPWLEITNAVSPFVVGPSNSATFFRLRQTSEVTDFGFRYVAPTFTTLIGDPVGCGCTSPENPNSLGADGNVQDNGLGNVLLHTGELTQQTTDLWIPGRGFDWRFTRRYRSGMSYDGPLGQGWDFSHNRRLMVETNGNVLCMDGLGRADRYLLNTNGTLDSPAGFYTRLTRKLDGTFEERERHGTTNLYAATNSLGVARLTRVSDRNGNQMTFQYNTAGQLTNVVDTLGRSIAYHYDANGRLTNVLDFIGRSLRFAYDPNSNLTSATSPAVTGTPHGNDFPSGKTTGYTYAGGFGDARFNHNLLSVTAPNEVAVGGSPRLVAQYDTNSLSPHADRLVSLRLGGTNAGAIAAGGTIHYAYTSFGPAASNDFATAVFQNTATNRNGNVTRYQFNQLGNVVRTVQFTRGIHAGDPPAFTNTFAYNSDGELIARTNAELDVLLNTFDSGSPDRLQQGNLLQVQHLPGPRGGDQAQIITSQTYETNFNLTVTSTDGRGNITTNRHDARGNRTNILHRIPSIAEDFEYNAFGQMTAHVLPDNGSGHRRRDTMSYYNSGPQNGYLESRVADSGGFNLTTTYEYDGVGNVIRTVDPRGNDTLDTYNALNQLIQQTSHSIAGGVRITNLNWYDANNNLVRVDVQNRDALGVLQASNTTFTTMTEFDILDERTREVQEKGSANLANSVVDYPGIPSGLRPAFVTVEYRYDANGNRNLTRFGQATSGTDPFNVVQMAYDERDLLFQETRAPGSPDQSTTQTDYDQNGNTLRTLRGTESVPRTNSYSYDGYDRLVRTLDPMGNTRTNRYDANGNVTTNRVDGQLVDGPGSAGNTNLSQTAFTYDALDRRIRTDASFFNIQTQAPIGDGLATTRFFYSDNSQVVATLDDNTNQTSYAYDTANRLLTITDARSNTVSYLYDPNSNLEQKTELDRSDIPGQTNETFTTEYVYDSLDRLIRTTDNAGITNQYAYDSRNNLTLSTNGRGNRTLYSYDGFSRKIETVYLLTDNGDGSGTVTGGITNKQTWDDSSRRTARTDGNTNTTQYAYDSLDRLVRTIHADGTTNSIVYDLYDDGVVVTDPNGSSVFVAHDLLGRVTSNYVVRAAGVLGTTSEAYSYDGLSRVVAADNNDSGMGYSYDSLSHQTGESRFFFSPIVGYLNVTMKYDGVGNLTQVGYPRTVVRTFDALNRLKISRFDPPGPGATNAVFQYIGRSRVARIEYGNGVLMDAAYDSDGRVREIQHHASPPFYDRAYLWDPDHNLLSNSNVMGSDFRLYQYDSLDRLVRTDDSALGSPTLYAFDAVGNRTNVNQGPGVGAYFMDPANPPRDLQMNQYTTGPTNTSRAYDENGNLTSVNGHTLRYDFRNRLVQVDSQIIFKYDCFGRRIEKSVYGYTNWIIHVAGVEMQEAQFPPSSLDPAVSSYVWGGGELLQMTGTNGRSYFFHADHLGNPIALTDTNASVVESWQYDDYGTPSPPSSTVGNPFFYRGNRLDQETGLYLAPSGYLDPTAGRFISRMAVGERSLGNTFTFASNNPLSLQSDPGRTCGKYWLEQGPTTRSRSLNAMATWQPPVPTEMTPLDFRGIPSVAQPPQDPPPAPTQDPPPKPPCGEPIIEGIEYRRDDAEFKWLRLPTKTTRVFHEGTHVYFRPIVQCGKCDKYECSADVNYTASISPSAKGGGFRPRKVLNEGENESGPRWNDYYVNPWGSFDLDVQVSVSCTFGESCERSKTAKTSFKAKWRDLDKEPEPK